MTHADPTPRQLTLSILSLVCFNFTAYVCNGLPLAVLPGHVVNGLGYSSVVAGLLIGVQYIAGLLCRPLAGTLADRLGAKRSVTIGLAALATSGGLTTLGLWMSSAPAMAMALLMAGRVIQGAAASLISTPCCTWAIGLHGTAQSTRVMSWNGIAAYSGTAVGAPVGVFVHHQFGLAGIGVGTVLIAASALAYAIRKPAAPLQAGARLPFGQVFRTVLPNGIAMACSSAGFGCLTAFIALYFGGRGWANAAYCLTGFGVAFVAARLATPQAIARFGGYTVVLVCLGVQSLGLLLVWLAPVPALAILGASLTGLGVSWVYPGLAMETLARTPASNRNSALSVLSLFFDLAVGLAGPVMGFVAAGFGLQAVFLVAGLLSTGGLWLVWRLRQAG